MITRIGEILLSILPDDAVAITLTGEADVDYTSSAFTLHGPDGAEFHFSWDDDPDEAHAEIGDLMSGLWKLMTDDGGEPWYGLRMIARRDGSFDVDFSYDPPED